MKKREIICKGYKWGDRFESKHPVDISNKDIPDNTKTLTEEYVGKIIECEHNEICGEQCTGAFKIVPEEFSFYKRLNLALPHLCPNCRHYQRLKQINPMKLWHRSCMCNKENHDHMGNCKEEFETSYSPKRVEIVYCEKCYQKEVY